jgi:hypothetical protein
LKEEQDLEIAIHASLTNNNNNNIEDDGDLLQAIERSKADNPTTNSEEYELQLALELSTQQPLISQQQSHTTVNTATDDDEELQKMLFQSLQQHMTMSKQ